jgi:polar amino acid transport system substrate-binding protein
MMSRSRFLQLSAFAAMALPQALAWASEPPALTVAWRDKPPYHYLDKEQPRGFLLERAQRIFAAAGIPARFVTEPQKRIWANFEHGTPNYCSISWYKLPQRERVGNYSEPIHIDPPQIVLIAPAALARVKAHPTLASLMADRTLTLGVVDGVSYGPELDALIAHGANTIMRRTVATTAMMRMLSVDRASYMLADRADWDFFRDNEVGLKVIERHDFPDMAPGVRRHIVCSKDVPPETMARINQAIAATGGASDGANTPDGKKNPTRK